MDNTKDYKLVIFDLDGTLINSAPDIILTAKHVVRSFGFPKRDDDFIINNIGRGARALVQKCAGDIDDKVLDAATEAFTRYYTKNCSKDSYLYPGVIESLRDLNAHGIKAAVATMKAHKATLKILRDYKILKYFESVITLDDVKKGKPDPECIENILLETGFARGQALIVGDAPTDILAGINAGVDTCAALYGFTEAQILAEHKPDHMIKDFPSLKAIVLNN